MVSSRRKGFTLIELIVVMAIFVILMTITFGTLARYFSAKAANEQLTILQQNFRVAVDRISYDFRQASSEPVIQSPEDNSVSDTLTFTGADGVTISYKLASNNDGSTCAIKRKSGDGQWEPVTEDMLYTGDFKQFYKLYFVRSGGKIVIIIVAEAKYFGIDRKQNISFASMVFSRNENYERP